MKIKAIALLSLLCIGLFTTSCDPEDVKPVLGINCTRTQCLDLEKFAEGIESRLDGKVMKYGYHIRSGFAVHEKAVGLAKTFADGGNVNFTLDQRFNPASVTKTVTAVALLRAMEQNGIGIHQSISPYLPTSWNAHSSINAITFEQVLGHRSGFRNSVAETYTHAGVKKIIEAGVNSTDKVYKYQNVNYALARVLLAHIIGFNDLSFVGEEIEISLAFQAYLNDELFSPVGISDVKFTPEANAALFYAFPAGAKKGTAYGDWILREGSAGIQLSIHDLEEFLMRMWTPGTYLSQNMLDQVKQYHLGAFEYNSSQGFPDGIAYGHNGYFPPWDGNLNAELSSVIVRFASGVQVVLVINGPVSATSTVVDAYQAAWENK
ncbi:MAG: serine hydrolase domain-containing protein [Bacteroidia bacterium]